MRRSDLVSCVSLGALFGFAAFLPSAAAGQTTESAAPTQSVSDSGDGDIVVTAQKREESVQDVPSSISVLGGGQLEKLQAKQLTDYAAYVPGFQVDSKGAPGATQITLRGINAAPQAGASVGTYIDDSPIGPSSKNTFGSSFALDLMPYDVERIEVLRGPQGTLYGASTMGGLLKYVMRSPDLDTTEVRAGSDVSTIRHGDKIGWGIRAGVNLPLITDKLGIRASYFKQYTPGFIDNSRTGREDENAVKQEGGRVALLWQATDNFSIKLSGMIQKIHSDNNAMMALRTSDQQPVDGDLRTNRLVDEPLDNKVQFYTATLDWDFGWASLTSATSYSRTETHQVQDTTPANGSIIPFFTGGAIAEGRTPTPLDLYLKKVTQELRLTSPGGGKVEWLAGIFLTREDWQGVNFLFGETVDGVRIPGLDPIGEFHQDETYKEGAIFGDLTYRFTDRFDVTVGARVAQNKEKFRSQAASILFPASDVTVRDSADIFTYMISPRWHINDNAMVYARIASGYRPGGGNAALFPVVPSTVAADTLVNYEMGVKGDFFDRKLTLDASLFYIDWKDIQVKAFEPTTGLDYIANGPSAKSQGVELSLLVRPVQGLRLGLNGSYVDAKLTQTADPSLNLGVLWLKGARLPLSPRFSGAATANYEVAVSDSLTVNFGGGFRHVGNRLSLVESDINTVRLPSYEVLDLNIGLSKDRWDIRLFAKNLTDERALLSTSSPARRPVLYTTVLQPRTIGLAFDLRFGGR